MLLGSANGDAPPPVGCDSKPPEQDDLAENLDEKLWRMHAIRFLKAFAAADDEGISNRVYSIKCDMPIGDVRSILQCVADIFQPGGTASASDFDFSYCGDGGPAGVDDNPTHSLVGSVAMGNRLIFSVLMNNPLQKEVLYGAEADKIAELDSMAVYVHEMVEWEKKSKVARSPSERTISISSSIRLCPFWNCISLEMSVNTPCVS